LNTIRILLAVNVTLHLKPAGPPPRDHAQIFLLTHKSRQARFCELIGIENKLDCCEENRDAKVAAGPRGGDT